MQFSNGRCASSPTPHWSFSNTPAARSGDALVHSASGKRADHSRRQRRARLPSRSRLQEPGARIGNTSAGSIPIALDEVFRDGGIDRGDLLLTSGFGAGLNWGTALLALVTRVYERPPHPPGGLLSILDPKKRRFPAANVAQISRSVDWGGQISPALEGGPGVAR